MDSNIKDQLSLVHSLQINRLYVVKETNTAFQHVNTMNPQTIFMLEPFYVKAPYENKSINLEWHISSRQGTFHGIIEMQIEAEIKDVDYIYDDAKIGHDFFSDYIEYVK